MDLNMALSERTERATARTRRTRAKAKTGTMAARPAQAHARPSAQLARVHVVGISDTILGHVRPAWVWKGQFRRRKNTQARVEEIGQKVKARAKASSVRAKAMESKTRKACMQSMVDTRPSGICRPIGPKKDEPRRMSTPEQFTMKMIR